jgi:molybdopterin synthase catalytic subunit
MVELTYEAIDESQLIERVRSPQAGAIVLFLGTTREFTGGRQTRSLDYECYADMAQRKLSQIEAQACDRWPLVACAIVHRLGNVPLAETSVAIAVSSPHRKAALEAGGWLIDTLKQVVPIWKKEQFADGTSEWVHPGLAGGPTP